MAGTETILLALSAASTAVGVVSDLKQANLAKRRAAEAAKQRELETQRQLAQLRRESAERKARNRALRAAYGGDSTSRSAFALQTENLRRDADNILAARVSGGSAVRGIQLQGKADSQAFKGSALQTAFAGGKTLLSSSNRRVSSSRPYSGRGATSF